MKLKAPDKAKILREAEVKILPFSNRKQTGINTIMFLPIAEFSSSLTHDQPLLTLGDTHWAAGWVILSSHTPTGMADVLIDGCIDQEVSTDCLVETSSIHDVDAKNAANIKQELAITASSSSSMIRPIVLCQ